MSQVARPGLSIPEVPTYLEATPSQQYNTEIEIGFDKVQIITVANKGQLIAAVGCAINFPGATEITLIRKTGKTVYRFDSLYDELWLLGEYNIALKKVRGCIRKIPAECFR